MISSLQLAGSTVTAKPSADVEPSADGSGFVAIFESAVASKEACTDAIRPEPTTPDEDDAFGSGSTDQTDPAEGTPEVLLQLCGSDPLAEGASDDPLASAGTGRESSHRDDNRNPALPAMPVASAPTAPCPAIPGKEPLPQNAEGLGQGPAGPRSESASPTTACGAEFVGADVAISIRAPKDQGKRAGESFGLRELIIFNALQTGSSITAEGTDALLSEELAQGAAIGADTAAGSDAAAGGPDFGLGLGQQGLSRMDRMAGGVAPATPDRIAEQGVLRQLADALSQT